MENKIIVRKKVGEVVATKSERTATVVVESVKQDPLYHKKFLVHKKFICENPDNKFQVGDLVEIVPTRPLSRLKHYLISRKIND